MHLPPNPYLDPANEGIAALIAIIITGILAWIIL
jgi:hypothetical protein